MPQFAEAIKQQAAAETRTEAATLLVRDLLGEDTTTFACLADSGIEGSDESGGRGGGGASKPILDAIGRDGRAYVYTHGHPHFILRVSLRPELSAKEEATTTITTASSGSSVYLSEMQRINNHVCVGEPYEWRIFDEWRDQPALADLTLEVRHRFPARWSRPVAAATDDSKQEEEEEDENSEEDDSEDGDEEESATTPSASAKGSGDRRLPPPPPRKAVVSARALERA